MTEFRHMHGRVYILENEEAKRVKVGMTTNRVEERLRDVNNMWLGIKGTCQICGGRRFINGKGFINRHVLSGVHCPGSNSLPFEKDSSLAISYLTKLENNQDVFNRSNQGSFTKLINQLKQRISRFQALGELLGHWKINTVYHTTSAENVELHTHDILSDCLDKGAPIGEIFSCSIEEARNAVELALDQLKLLQSAKKDVCSLQD